MSGSRIGQATMFLGIDLGTSAVKAALVDEDDRIVGSASASLQVQRPQALWSEQSPEDWWRATVEAVTALPSELRTAVRGIGLSGQMHGATLLDRADRPLRPAILWNDGRSEGECAELETREPRSRSITGNLAMPGFTAPKLLWVRKHEPDVFARVARVLLPKDYLRFRLTGDYCSDMSDAAGTLWLDVARRDWSDAMLAATSLDRSHMPRLVEGSQSSGQLTAVAATALGLPRVPVAGGGGDNAASAVGAGVIAPGQAFLSLGTSGVIFAATDRFLPNTARATHAFCHALPGRWHQMSVMLNAASALDWVTALTGFADVPTAAAAASGRGLHAGTPFFLPYLSGERTPHNDASARGVFFGMTPKTTGADLVVAVLEGVSFGFADGQDALVEAGVSLDGPLTVLGGAARLDFWATMLASALDRPLARRPGSQFGAALGAARLGRIAVTGEAVDAVCIEPPLETLVEPDLSLASQLRDRRPTFSRLYRQLQPVFRESVP